MDQQYKKKDLNVFTRSSSSGILHLSIDAVLSSEKLCTKMHNRLLGIAVIHTDDAQTPPPLDHPFGGMLPIISKPCDGNTPNIGLRGIRAAVCLIDYNRMHQMHAFLQEFSFL